MYSSDMNLRNAALPHAFFSAVTVENLRAFGPEQTALLRPLTLIYGPNSGGKSTLLKAMRWLNSQGTQTDNKRLTTSVSLSRGGVDLGAFSQATYRNRKSSPIRISAQMQVQGFRLTSPEKIWPSWQQYIQASRRTTLSVLLGPPTSNQQDRAELLEISDGKFALRLQTVKVDREGSSEEDRRLADIGLGYNEVTSTPLPSRAYSVEGADAWLKRLGFDAALNLPDNRIVVQNRGEFGPFSTYVRWDDSLCQVFPESFHIADTRSLDWTKCNMLAVPPLREMPARLHRRSFDADQTIWQKLLDDDGLTARINTYLELLELPYTVLARSLPGGSEDWFTVTLKDRRTGSEVSPQDVGFGISQVAPLLFAGALNRKSVICVEQPEVHLHPRLQARLADFLIDTMKTDWNQWLVETHSESLMLRVQRRIREGNLDFRDVSVLYVDAPSKGRPYSVIHELRLDERGNFLDLWPDGFFPERLLDDDDRSPQ